MDLSVIIITYRRPFLLRRCLESIVPQISESDAEVLVYINGDDCASQDLLEKMKRAYPVITYVAGKRCSRGAARNVLLKRAAGEIVYFLDDDVAVQENAVQVLLRAADAYHWAAILGGPNLCFPRSDWFQIAQSQVLGSFLGSAWMSIRYQEGRDILHADERSLSLCNLAIRAPAIGRGERAFHEDLVSCEENLLLRQMLARGFRSVFLKKLIVFHERRHTVKAVCRQMFQYGKGRMQTIKICPASYDLVFVIPSLFLCYIAALPLLIFWPIALLPLVLYVFLVSNESIKVLGRCRSLCAVSLTFVLFPIVHVCYGAGFLAACFGERREKAPLGPLRSMHLD